MTVNVILSKVDPRGHFEAVKSEARKDKRKGRKGWEKTRRNNFLVTVLNAGDASHKCKYKADGDVQYDM